MPRELAIDLGTANTLVYRQGNLIVDVGGGTTELAVVSMGGVVSGVSIRTGGFDLDAAIADHVRTAYGVAIGEKAAEEIKIAIGSAFPAPRGAAAALVGRELSSGAPTEVQVTEDEGRQA